MTGLQEVDALLAAESKRHAKLHDTLRDQSGVWDSLNRISRVEQFGAVLRKNFILLTRRRRVLCGLGGWAALILEVRALW